jgi:hypothetical protein
MKTPLSLLKWLLLSTVLIVSASFSRAAFLDQLFNRTPRTNSSSLALNALSQDQVVLGLKEALTNGIKRAVAELGHDGGFLTNLNVRIPMPEKLHTVEKTLRALKQDRMADEFVATMNHAAEQAVPQAIAVFSDSIRAMTIQDAKSILTGPNDAATQYFRRVNETNLFIRFLPIVKVATDKTGVTSTYKKLVESANAGKIFGSFGSSVANLEAVDIDQYVTTKALDGLFKMVAEEEKRIRADPVARTSQLLQNVFGAITKK